ncbi:MAG: hypothetical protein DME26_05730 [Verrucomicrobia bacterium]|nr:MAG: hypothetical protein DME26_05730 [Verrucomicrobiota bacterium]
MKTKLITSLRGAWAGFLLAGFVVLSAGCVVRGGGGVVYSEAPYYDYYYYPEANVYFYPSGRVYYWRDGEHWRSGRRVPSRYSFHEGRREPLRLRTREPWTEHHR